MGKRFQNPQHFFLGGLLRGHFSRLSFRAMNTQRRISLTRALSPFIALPLLGVLPSCSGEPPALTIGEVEYTEPELLTFNAGRRTRLAELTAFGLAVARGELNSLGDPLLRRRGQEALLESLERELALRFAGVDDAALQARYKTNPEYELSVRHLVILVEEWATDEEESEARSRAEAALARIRAGEPFPQVAGQLSEEPGAAERGGLLQPGRKGSWVEEFWTAASALEVGGVSDVVSTPYGFHVLKLEGREPIPFPEARFQVVEEVAASLPGKSEEIQLFVDSVGATLVVDSATLERGLEESGSLFSLTRHEILAEGSGVILAEWSGGSFSGKEFRTFLIGLERSAWEHVSEGGLPELLRAATNGARRERLSDEAHAQGVILTPQMEATIRREWEETAFGWAQGLGFQEGMSVDALKAASFEAVASSAQGARIAREALRRWGPLLLSAYPIGP